ncbi:MAG: hypothetical protein HQL98_13590 [Magnetococcales bacterium]|nr:hypothetical protein [Magnetococcales bacterium]
MLDTDLSQVKLLVQEAQKRLDAILPQVPSLMDGDPTTGANVLDSLLRTIRGIGGSAIFHDLTHIVSLSQSMESLITRMREAMIFVQPESVQVLLSGLKKLQQLLNDVTACEAISIDSETVAIQAILAVYSDPPHFDLRHYPQAVSQAVLQGLHFFSIHIPLSGTPEVNRKKFNEVKEAVQVVGTLVASLPDLGHRIDWRDGIRVGVVRLLVSTVLQQDLLLGLSQLPSERIVLLPIPEEMKKIELVDLSPAPEEDPESDDLPEPEVYEEEEQLGDIEDRIRQAHLDEIKRQRLALEDQEQEKQRQAVLLENERQLQRKRQHLRTLGGIAAGGLLVAASVWVVLGRPVDPTPPAPVAQTQVTTVAKVSDPAPKPPVLVTESKSASPAPAAPVTLQPAPPAAVRPPTEDSKPVTTAPTTVPAPQSTTAATPESKPAPALPAETQAAATPTNKPETPSPATATPGKETPAANQAMSKPETPSPATAPSGKETPTAKGTVVADADSKVPANKETKPATAEQTDKDPNSTAPFQVRFAKYHLPINRLLQEPYLKITPAKGTVRGGLTYERNKDGDVLFSIAQMMGHTAFRPEDQFTITPDSISAIRIVFQVDRGIAYLFEFGQDGTVVVPAAFWDPFSKSTKKGVSISKVVKKTPDGIHHLRDISAVSVGYIAKTVGIR